MSNKKSIRKYSAATMATAVAATAVVPIVASADESGFPDVTESGTGSHYENILALKEAGIVKGDSGDDGNFRPFENISRVQVALMLQRALKLEVPADPAKVLEKYNDINIDKLQTEQLEAIAALSEAGIFTGSDGEFGMWDDITRQQMASVIVRAYNLDEIEVDEEVDVNFDNSSVSHRENIQVLANLGITTEPQDFRAYEELSRQQFASFLKRSMDVAADHATEDALEQATRLVESFEAAVNTPEKAVDLVTNRDKREEVAASFVPATNAIQKVEGNEKEELANRLDSANNVIIAAGSVDTLQNATNELTEDNLDEAKSALTKAQNFVNLLADEDIKNALTALIDAEEDKINEFEFNIAKEITKVTVADINDPINAGEDTELTFTVIMDNGTSKEFTKVEFEEAFTDYTVEFYYVDKSVLGEKADEGIVNPDKDVEEFKYQVEIFDPYQDSVAERSNAATVKVQDEEALAEEIVEVTELELQDSDGNKVDSVRPDQTAKVVATKGLNKLGDPVENPEVEIEEAEFETNKFGYITIADGTINLLNADNNVGETETLTVKFAGIEQAVTIDVTVAEKGIADQLVTPSITTVTDQEVDLTEGVQVFNQYGEEIAIDRDDITVSNITGENAPTDFSTGKVTFTEAGEYTVYYKAKGLQGPGTAKVIVAPDNDNWHLDFALELNGENRAIDVSAEDGPESLEFTTTGLFEGADITHLFPADVKLDVKSSDEDVATVALEDEDAEVKDAKIKVTAVSEGTTTITVSPMQGDMQGQIVTIQIEVVDSAVKLDEDSFDWKVEKLPKGTELTEDNLAEYLTVKDVNGEEVDISELEITEILNVGQGFIVTFDEKHGVDDQDDPFDAFINFE